MAESDELFAEVAGLRDEVDDQGTILDALVRASGTKEQLLTILRADELLREVFLLVDGQRTQSDIVVALKEKIGKGSPATVSGKLKELRHDHELVRPTSRDKSGLRYVHTRLAKALNIVRALSK